MRFISIFLICTAMLRAQQISAAAQPPFMRVHGEATVSVEPDQLQFDIGVVTQAGTAKEATDQNDSQSKALINELRAAFPSASVKSINFSVNPNYHYPAEGPPTIAGYTSSNTVRLLLNDISKLQNVIDIAIKSGAKSINRLTFTLQDESPVRAKAFAKAADQAQAGAQALAASLKLRLGKLLSVEEGQPVLVSPPRQITLRSLHAEGGKLARYKLEFPAGFEVKLPQTGRELVTGGDSGTIEFFFGSAHGGHAPKTARNKSKITAKN